MNTWVKWTGFRKEWKRIINGSSCGFLNYWKHRAAEVFPKLAVNMMWVCRIKSISLLRKRWLLAAGYCYWHIIIIFLLVWRLSIICVKTVTQKPCFPAHFSFSVIFKLTQLFLAWGVWTLMPKEKWQANRKTATELKLLSRKSQI